MVGTFQAAPGSSILGVAGDLLAAGTTARQLAGILAGTAAFKSIYSIHLNHSFGLAFVDNMFGNTVDAASKASLAAAIGGYLDAYAGSADAARGDAVYLVTTALANMPTTDPVWGRAAQQFANRVAAADYYSVAKGGHADSFGALQSVVASVTDNPMSLARQFDAIDAALAAGPNASVAAPDLSVNAGDTLYGSDKNDTFAGTAGNDVIYGGAGADTITAGLGVNVVNGGDGDDKITGATPQDVIDGGAGNDTLQIDATNVTAAAYAPLGDDRLRSVETISVSGDTALALDLSGQSEGFTLKLAGSNGHTVTCGSGAYTITASGGAYTIYAAAGSGKATGGGGNDTFYAGSGTFTFDGGAGTDTLKLAASTLNAATFTPADDTKIANVENIDVSGSTAIKVNLSSQKEGLSITVSGASGQSVIGGAGNDSFVGARDKDYLDGGAGTDTLKLSSANVAASKYAPSADAMLANVETVAVTGDIFVIVDLSKQLESFTITASGTGGHQITAGAGSDTITGSAAMDVLCGGNGADVINGGGGADVIDLAETSPARDTISYAAAADFGDVVRGFDTASAAASVDQLKLDKSLLNGVGGSTSTGVAVSIVTSTATSYALNATVVIVRNATVAPTPTAAAVAAFLDPYGNNASYGADDKMIFAIADTQGNTLLYDFVSTAAGNALAANEFTLIATLAGVKIDALTASNFTQ